MSADLLLEIGSEEIPDWMIPGALEHLGKLAQELAAHGGSVRTDATPRRLVVRIVGLDPEQSLATYERGPKTSAPAGAVAGFARKWGVAPVGITVRGECVRGGG